MRRQIDLKRAVDQLVNVRVLHHTQPAPTLEDPRAFKVVSIEHPALITLLEQGTGTTRGSGAASGGGGAPSPVDAGALETWGQIRDQVRVWLGQLRAPWSDDLRTDLRAWYERHELAVARGRVDDDALEVIERTVEAWVERIERKYDPDERREWTDPCPAVLRHDQRTGTTHRCGARRITVDGTLQFAVTVNVTRRTVECRACETRWEGDRELMRFRYEANLAELERDLVAAAEDMPARELTSTGPIDLP